jgi:hypothetical protein
LRPTKYRQAVFTNRIEYENTIRDLLESMSISSKHLPEDAQAHGFDSRPALAVSTELITAYLNTADLASMPPLLVRGKTRKLTWNTDSTQRSTGKKTWVNYFKNDPKRIAAFSPPIRQPLQRFIVKEPGHYKKSS